MSSQQNVLQIPKGEGNQSPSSQNQQSLDENISSNDVPELKRILVVQNELISKLEKQNEQLKGKQDYQSDVKENDVDLSNLLKQSITSKSVDVENTARPLEDNAKIGKDNSNSQYNNDNFLKGMQLLVQTLNKQHQKHVDIKPFDDEKGNIYKWLEQFEGQAQRLGLSDNEAIMECTYLLPKRVRNQVREQSFNTFKQMCNFIRQNNQQDRQLLEAEYYRLQKHESESYVAFNKRLLEVAEELDLHEGQHLSRFIMSLPQNIKEDLIDYRYQDASSLAKLLDLKINRDQNKETYNGFQGKFNDLSNQIRRLQSQLQEQRSYPRNERQEYNYRAPMQRSNYNTGNIQGNRQQAYNNNNRYNNQGRNYTSNQDDRNRQNQGDYRGRPSYNSNTYTNRNYNQNGGEKPQQYRSRYNEEKQNKDTNAISHQEQARQEQHETQIQEQKEDQKKLDFITQKAQLIDGDNKNAFSTIESLKNFGEIQTCNMAQYDSDNSDVSMKEDDNNDQQIQALKQEINNLKTIVEPLLRVDQRAEQFGQQNLYPQKLRTQQGVQQQETRQQIESLMNSLGDDGEFLEEHIRQIYDRRNSHPEESFEQSVFEILNQGKRKEREEGEEQQDRQQMARERTQAYNFRNLSQPNTKNAQKDKEKDQDQDKNMDDAPPNKEQQGTSRSQGVPRAANLESLRRNLRTRNFAQNYGQKDAFKGIIENQKSGEKLILPSKVACLEGKAIDWKSIINQIECTIPLSLIMKLENYKLVDSKGSEQDMEKQQSSYNVNNVPIKADTLFPLLDYITQIPTKGYHLIIPIQIQGQFFSTLIDGGSTISIISFKACKQLRLEDRIVGHQDAFNTLGGPTKPVGVIQQLLFTIGGVQSIWDFFVVDMKNKNFEILIGSDFLRRCQGIPDYGNNTFSFKTMQGNRYLIGALQPKAIEPKRIQNANLYVDNLEQTKRIKERKLTEDNYESHLNCQNAQAMQQDNNNVYQIQEQEEEDPSQIQLTQLARYFIEIGVDRDFANELGAQTLIVYDDQRQVVFRLQTLFKLPNNQSVGELEQVVMYIYEKIQELIQNRIIQLRNQITILIDDQSLFNQFEDYKAIFSPEPPLELIKSDGQREATDIAQTLIKSSQIYQSQDSINHRSLKSILNEELKTLAESKNQEALQIGAITIQDSSLVPTQNLTQSGLFQAESYEELDLDIEETMVITPRDCQRNKEILNTRYYYAAIHATRYKNLVIWAITLYYQGRRIQQHGGYTKVQFSNNYREVQLIGLIEAFKKIHWGLYGNFTLDKNKQVKIDVLDEEMEYAMLLIEKQLPQPKQDSLQRQLEELTLACRFKEITSIDEVEDAKAIVDLLLDAKSREENITIQPRTEQRRRPIQERQKQFESVISHESQENISFYGSNASTKEEPLAENFVTLQEDLPQRRAFNHMEDYNVSIYATALQRFGAWAMVIYHAGRKIRWFGGYTVMTTNHSREEIQQQGLVEAFQKLFDEKFVIQNFLDNRQVRVYTQDEAMDWPLYLILSNQMLEQENKQQRYLSLLAKAVNLVEAQNVVDVGEARHLVDFLVDAKLREWQELTRQEAYMQLNENYLGPSLPEERISQRNPPQTNQRQPLQQIREETEEEEGGIEDEEEEEEEEGEEEIVRQGQSHVIDHHQTNAEAIRQGFFQIPITTQVRDQSYWNEESFTIAQQHSTEELFEDFEYTLLFDGASTKVANAIAYVLYKGEEKISQHAQYVNQDLTNNEVEYQALLTSLRHLTRKKLQNKKILVLGDSQLVVNQVMQTFKTKEQRLNNILDQIKEYLKRFPNLTLQHIRRNLNQEPNDLAQALTQAKEQELKDFFEGLKIQQQAQRVVGQYQEKIEDQLHLLYPNLPREPYDLIVMDPPFKHPKKLKGSPKYPTLTLHQLQILPINNMLTKNGVLLLWTPGPFMKKSMELIQLWGLRFVNIVMVWRKINQKGEPYQGLGLITNHNYEFLILATKGDIEGSLKNGGSHSQEICTYEIQEEVTIHSQKPNIFYERIKEIFKVEQMKCLELFNRGRNEVNHYLDLYGNEVQNYFQPSNSREQFIDIEEELSLIQSQEVEPQILEISNTPNDLPLRDPLLELKYNEDTTKKLQQLKVGDKLVPKTKEMYQILEEFLDVFCWNYPQELTGTRTLEHRFDLKPGSQPIAKKYYRVTQEKDQFIQEQIDELLGSGMIEPSGSPYAAPVVLREKKDKTLRMCINFKGLNTQTIPDKYPMQRNDDCLDLLQGQIYFVTLDLKSGFWQIFIANEQRYLTAFIVRQGIFQWVRMPFGLINAPATQQRLMDTVLEGLIRKGVLVYIDDIIVYGRTLPELYSTLRVVLERLREHGLKLNQKKCHFFIREKVEFLGHLVSEGKIQPQPDKIENILKIQMPQSHKQMRQFLGSVNYIRRFIPNLDVLLKPLSKMTRSTKPFIWSEEAKQNFEDVKKVLATQPKLCLPDYSKEFIVHTFWNPNTGLYAILTQLDPKTRMEEPIEYAAKSITETQEKYEMNEGQLYCIVWAIQKWEHVLQNKRFTLVVEQNAIKWILDNPPQKSKLAKWSIIIQQFDYIVETRANRQNRAMLTKLMQSYQKQQQNLESFMMTDYDPLNNLYCQICKERDEANPMILCDNYNHGFHLTCIGMTNVPKEYWYCQECLELIITNKAIDPTQDLEMLDYLEHGYLETSLSSTQKEALKDRSSQYVFQNNTLYLKAQTQDGEQHLKEIPPIGNRALLIMQLHRNIGHLGQRKTLGVITRWYYWPFIIRDVKRILKGCLVCQAQKVKYYDIPGAFPTKLQQGPFSLVSLDCVTGLKETMNGDTAIVVAICAYSKWVEARAIPHPNSANIAKFFLEDILARFGAPLAVRTDNGSEFKGEFKQLLEVCGIKQIFTTPHYKQANGQVERMNQTIQSSLRKLFQQPGFEQEWDQCLPWTLLGIRATIARGTDYSPYQIIYGRDMVIPGFIVDHQELIEWKEPQNQDVLRYIMQTLEKHEVQRKKIQQNLQEMYQEIEKDLLSKRDPTIYDFELGDLVYVQQWRQTKLDLKSIGPYVFLRYNDERKITATIYNPSSKRELKASTSNLAPCKIV